MTRRKGEITPAGIDKGWPHQVAVPAMDTLGLRYVEAIEFCDGLSLAPRRPSFARDDVWFNVWCFAKPEDAETFQRQYGGELMTPKTRPKWPGGR